MSILEETLTDYQRMEISEQKIFIQRILNLATCSQRSFKVLLHTIEREEAFCKETFIKLPLLNPIYNQ